MWPSVPKAVSSVSSGIVVNVESDMGTVSSVDSMTAKPSIRISTEVMKHLRDASGNFLFVNVFVGYNHRFTNQLFVGHNLIKNQLFVGLQ